MDPLGGGGVRNGGRGVQSWTSLPKGLDPLVPTAFVDPLKKHNVTFSFFEHFDMAEGQGYECRFYSHALNFLHLKTKEKLFLAHEAKSSLSNQSARSLALTNVMHNAKVKPTPKVAGQPGKGQFSGQIRRDFLVCKRDFSEFEWEQARREVRC